MFPSILNAFRFRFHDVILSWSVKILLHSTHAHTHTHIQWKNDGKWREKIRQNLFVKIWQNLEFLMDNKLKCNICFIEAQNVNMPTYEHSCIDTDFSGNFQRLQVVHGSDLFYDHFVRFWENWNSHLPSLKRKLKSFWILNSIAQNFNHFKVFYANFKNFPAKRSDGTPHIVAFIDAVIQLNIMA